MWLTGTEDVVIPAIAPYAVGPADGALTTMLPAWSARLRPNWIQHRGHDSTLGWPGARVCVAKSADGARPIDPGPGLHGDSIIAAWDQANLREHAAWIDAGAACVPCHRRLRPHLGRQSPFPQQVR